MRCFWFFISFLFAVIDVYAEPASCTEHQCIAVVDAGVLVQEHIFLPMI